MIVPAANRLSRVEEYYFSTKLQEVHRLAEQGHDIINLGIGNPDLPPSPATIAALSQTASNEQNHGYQPYRGHPQLRRAMAEWYDQVYQVQLHPESEVLPLIGSKEGIFHISMAFLNAGDRVLVPDPGYLGYSAVTRLVGGIPVYYDLTEANNWLPDLETLNRLDTSSVKIMWLNYPHMPTGAVATEDVFRELVAFAREQQILLCHDNPYSLILNEEAPLSILKVDGAFDACLELNSLSKSHNMAGWRVSMVAGKSTYLDAILKVKSNLDSGMFLPIQLAAVQALKNSAEWHQARNQRLRQRQKLVYELLDALNFTYHIDTAGMFVWAKAPQHIKDVEAFLDELLYSKGIFLAPGKIFGKNGERYIRVSICAAKENIQKAIERIESN